MFSDTRDSVRHIRVLEQGMIHFPADRWLLSEDNLSPHTSREVRVALLAWPEVQIQLLPKYACWLNLIEPWWKQMRSLALKGHRFETIDELVAVLEAALSCWNDRKHPYRWKKQPQEHPTILLGGFHPQLVSKTAPN